MCREKGRQRRARTFAHQVKLGRKNEDYEKEQRMCKWKGLIRRKTETEHKKDYVLKVDMEVMEPEDDEKRGAEL